MKYAAIPALCLACLSLAAAASQAEEVVTSPDAFVITRHEAELEGRQRVYEARAGMLPLLDNETGELLGRVFVVAYVAEPRRGEAPRPLTFIWNGGPGASSSQVNLVGFGPVGLDAPDTYPEWIERPPGPLVDRPDSWLAVSDLVFVDPPGTGYSRATSLENRDLLYTRRGDIEAVAEVIRLYRTRFDAWDAPLFIAGESYGADRAMGVADALERRRAGLSGVILISGNYDAGQDVSPALLDALRVPTWAAAAHHHGRLHPELQALSRADAIEAANTWAREVYAPALARLDELDTGERESVLEGIEHHTGVDRAFVDETTLTLTGTTFADRLLDDLDLELGNYDYRMTFPRRDLSRLWVPTRDPSLAPMLDLMQGTDPRLVRYLRDTLGYRSDLLYQGPFGEGFHPAPLTDVTSGAGGPLYGIYTDWMTMKFKTRPPEGAAPPRPPPLVRAMSRNRDLLVWNIRGLYDSASCAALDEQVAATPSPLRERIRNSCYDGGHMLYTETRVRRDLLADFKAFIDDARAPGED